MTAPGATRRPRSPAGARYAPAQVLTNADLERMVDTSDEWIVSRTGIRERRVAAAARDHGLDGARSPACARSARPASTRTTST